MMDLKEAITVDDRLMFCAAGNSLALRFSAAAREAVIFARVGPVQDVAWRVEVALASLLVHRIKCLECDQV